MHRPTPTPFLLLALLFTLLLALLLPTLARAEVTRIEITRREPLAAGLPFGPIGPYEKLVGKAFFAVDPADAHNSGITDLDLVPTGGDGKVEFSTDLLILKPVHMERGNGEIFFEVNNRGDNIAFPLFNDTVVFPVNDPETAADVGNGFLMRQGYAIVWAGWEGDIAPTADADFTIQLPVPTADGTLGGPPITERIAVELTDRNFGGGTPFTQPFSGDPDQSTYIPYEAVSTDLMVAEAELRTRPSDSFRPPEAGIPEGTPVPAGQWSFAFCPDGPPGTPSPTHLCLATGFRNDTVYELRYRAKNPRVMGLGYVATRDVISFLRHGQSDDAGNPNPLAGSIAHTICQGSSSSGMYLRDFLFQGFNEDEAGRRVCDGMSIHIPGAHKLFLNYRFAQPNPFSVPHRDRHVPDVGFPVTYGIGQDPAGLLAPDGILRRCRQTGTCPKILHTDTSTEYWVFRSALVSTDGLGHDVPLPPEVRMYLLTGTQHYVFKGFPPDLGTGGRQLQQPSNATHPGVLMRALLVALNEWVTTGREPPPSRIPTVAEGTLVLPDRASVGFPEIPGVSYTGGLNASGERDFGPRSPRGENRGIIDNLLPIVLSEHVNLVPRADELGIDLGGLEQPVVAVPVATLTGWNLRTEEFTLDDLCDLCGMTVPLFETAAERLAAGDPRLSLEELYGTHGGYVARIAAAARRLERERFLLPEDVARIIEEAARSEVLQPAP